MLRRGRPEIHPGLGVPGCGTQATSPAMKPAKCEGGPKRNTGSAQGPESDQVVELNWRVKDRPKDPQDGGLTSCPGGSRGGPSAPLRQEEEESQGAKKSSPGVGPQVSPAQSPNGPGQRTLSPGMA